MGISATSNHLLALFPDGLAGKHIHAMGAGGIGTSAIIQLARAEGAIVTGCDVAETSMGRYLQGLGVLITLGHDPAHLTAGAPVDLLINAPAVTVLDPDQAEIAAARAHGIPTADWQELLGYVMTGKIGVSVAGVHGKGSTTALLGALAIAGGLDPTVEVGAVVPEWGSNIRIGHSAYFINEADEWNYNFLHYHPRVVVLTAVEYDHPEFFPSYEAIREAFERFLAGMDMAAREQGAAPPATLVLNADNAGCRDIRARLGDHWPGRVRSFGIESAEANVRARDARVAGETSFTLVLDGRELGQATLATPGLYSVYNALAAVAAADALGVASEVHVPALTAFGGLRRRFEITRDARGVTYVDDYAHHPHAVALTLETARLRFPGQRLIAIFQPTLYTRLHRFLEPFSAAFDAADCVGIVEIQPSRERDTGLVHGRDLVARIQARPAFADKADAVFYGGTFDETVAALRERLRPGDVLVVMGSGPVNRIIPPLRDAAGGRAATQRTR